MSQRPGPNMDNWSQGQGNQGWNYRNYNHDNNYNRINYGNTKERVGPYIPHRNWESSNREARGSMSHIEEIKHKMLKKFHATNENIKKMQNDYYWIGQKVEHHAVSIKKLK